MNSIWTSRQSPLSGSMLEIINGSYHSHRCQILIKEGHKVSWKRSSRQGKVMARRVGVGENFPDKQDRALGTKCAMESQFPTQRTETALLVLKYEKLSGFISSLFTLSPLHSRPKVEKDPQDLNIFLFLLC